MAKTTKFAFALGERVQVMSISAGPRENVVVGRAEFVDRLPSNQTDEPLPRTGEIMLTPGQKVALLKMRRSDWALAVVAHLEAMGQGEHAAADYRSLAQLSLAVWKGAFHALTPAGRWRADGVAMELARELGMHVITYDFGRSGRAACARCTCGWSAYRSRWYKSFGLLIQKDGRHHLEHVGAAPCDQR